ncbi:MAG: AMP-binding protein [Flavobacteriia bacterium]|nr:AMP-binding protein [Flavobacteriia bacterium]
MLKTNHVETIKSDIPLGEIVPNMAVFLRQNTEKFASKIVFSEKNAKGDYVGISWENFYQDILNIAYNLKASGVQKGDKIVLFSRNSLKMLEAELAIMSISCIAVPIFANFKKETAELLITHSDSKYVIVAEELQLDQMSEDLPIKKIWTFNDCEDKRFNNIEPFSNLLKKRKELDFKLDENADSKEICLNMYTSGTMGVPKCVQLSHQNILSQQVAIEKILKIKDNDRFLAYLPWHHSFGGIFELFSSLYNGATFYLESSFGKDAKEIFENWKLVKPTVFYSVPKVYQSLYELTLENNEAENTFFNSGLKFIFTAAASLPEKLSNEFEKRGIPVFEGWGLTETSPCCTITDPSVKRITGVVGKPIPGVEIRIAEDDEIQVKGPNVMRGYYKNDEANSNIFTDDGWYRTGDVGKITESGLQLISRKDRIFKLSNGEKVIPTDLEKAIELKCHYVQYAVVAGSGEEHPVALIFPNKRLLENPAYQLSPKDGRCFCPRSLNELGKCLTGCLAQANESIGQKFAKVKSAAVILDDLSLDTNTLTPSMKVAPKNVVEKYKAHLKNLYGDHVPVDEEVYVIQLDKVKNEKKHV